MKMGGCHGITSITIFPCSRKGRKHNQSSGSKKTTLTEEGRLLQKRAQEIIDLTQKTEAELRQSNTIIGGDVWIGGGETEGMRFIARTVFSLQKDFPDIHFHLFSGNTMDVVERLEKGLIDFGVGLGLLIWGNIIPYGCLFRMKLDC